MNSLSLNEIAYNLLNNLRGGRSSNNDYLSLEQIKFCINYYRAMFIRRDMWRNNLRSTVFEQDLGLLNLTKESTEGFDNENLILYKTVKIPTPVRLKNKEAITFVGTISNSGKPIPVVNNQRSYWNQFSKYTGNDQEAYYKDGYIFVKTKDTLSSVNVRGIFEDPEDVFDFVKDSGLDIYDGDQPYPISQDMIEGITKGLLKGELKLNVSTLNDDEADMLQDEQ